MKSVLSRSALGRRVASAAVLGLAATTVTLGVAGPANAANTIELQGKVTGANGAALANAYVEVVDATSGASIADTSTNPDGTYSFDSLPAGAVKVYFEADNPSLTLVSPVPYQDRWSGGSRYFEGASVTNVTVDPASAATVDANLPLYASISGKVTVGDDGHVATGYWDVWEQDADENYFYQRVRDAATGNYRVIVDPAGPARVAAYGDDSAPNVNYLVSWWKDADTLAAATPISLSPGQSVSGINFQLTNRLVSRRAPSIVGVPTVGRALTATPGTWNMNVATEFSYKWMRGAAVVGTGATYVPTVADFGQKLTVVVTALNGEHTGQAAAATSDVVRYPAEVKGKAKALDGRKVRFGVKIVSAKQSPVKGKVVVMRGTKVVHKAVKLVKGKAVIVVKGQPKGKQTYTVVYKGNSVLSKATKTFTVRVHS